MFRPLSLAVAALAFAACNQAPEQEFDLVTKDELAKRVDALDARVEAIGKGGGAVAAAPEVDEKAMAHEKAAYEKWKVMMQAKEAGDLDAVKQHIADIERDFADTRALVEIQSVKQELAVMGMDAPTFTADKWFSGEPTTLTDGKATVVVFWEVWCPHCQREVPKLDEMYAKYKGQGLNVVGVTQVSNGKTDEDVASFISENKVSYPTAKVGPELPNAFAVQGIPAAAVIKDGKVVWRGHPAQLNDEMITGWLGT